MFNSISRLVSTSKSLTFSAALVAAVAPAFVLGCGSTNAGTGSGTVGATAVAYDRATHALSAAPGNLKYLNGTYTGCLGHAAGDLVWSVPIDSFVGPGGTNPPLAVALNDTNCVLAITSLDADQNYSTAALDLNATFAGTPSQFTFTTGAAGIINTLAFYGNARIVPADFSSAFTIDFVYSDDPGLATGLPSVATFSQVTSAAASTQVVSPNYTADASGVTITTNASDVVVGGVGGTVTFGGGSNPGQDYVIVGAALADNTFATIDADFTTAAVGGVTTFSGTPTAIAGSAFIADDQTLPQHRTVIIRNTASGVVAYEAVALTFAVATP
jgi:hypothetical protein